MVPTLQKSFGFHLQSFRGRFVSVFIVAEVSQLTARQTAFESGGLTISCTMLYPEQFDALRRTYDCERSLIESLARCVKFDASGGKSGSAFLKTLGVSRSRYLACTESTSLTSGPDDRFIAKELSRAELQAMETFAPAYFDYMSSAVVANVRAMLHPDVDSS